MQEFKQKGAISGFPIFSGSAEALVRWGWKVKHLLIAYFRNSIASKNCQNQIMSEL